MNYTNVDKIKSEGFEGFVTLKDLIEENCNQVPLKAGVYFVLYLNERKPTLIDESLGGHFKGRNPTVTIKELEVNWNEGTIVIYIGKAGGEKSNATLQSRLRQYMRFGKGEPVGHSTERYIWQIYDSKNLKISWKVIEDSNSRNIEKDLISDFISQFGKRPFANLVG